MPKYRVLSHWEGKKQLWTSQKALSAKDAESAKRKAQRENDAWVKRIGKYQGEKPPRPIVGKVRVLPEKKKRK